MKKIFLFFLLLWSSISFGQCSDCTTLEAALKAPEKVKTLKFNALQQGVTLDSLPRSVAKLTNIEVMYISDHDIQTIPKEIGLLVNLKELSFAGCKLTRLPEEIFQLKNLRELVLLNNQFSQAYILEIRARFKKEMPRTKLLISGVE